MKEMIKAVLSAHRELKNGRCTCTELDVQILKTSNTSQNFDFDDHLAKKIAEGVTVDSMRANAIEVVRSDLEDPRKEFKVPTTAVSYKSSVNGIYKLNVYDEVILLNLRETLHLDLLYVQGLVYAAETRNLGYALKREHPLMTPEFRLYLGL